MGATCVGAQAVRERLGQASVVQASVLRLMMTVTRWPLAPLSIRQAETSDACARPASTAVESLAIAKQSAEMDLLRALRCVMTATCMSATDARTRAAWKITSSAPWKAEPQSALAQGRPRRAALPSTGCVCAACHLVGSVLNCHRPRRLLVLLVSPIVKRRHRKRPAARWPPPMSPFFGRATQRNTACRVTRI